MFINTTGNRPLVNKSRRVSEVEARDLNPRHWRAAKSKAHDKKMDIKVTQRDLGSYDELLFDEKMATKLHNSFVLALERDYDNAASRSLWMEHNGIMRIK